MLNVARAAQAYPPTDALAPSLHGNERARVAFVKPLRPWTASPPVTEQFIPSQTGRAPIRLVIINGTPACPRPVVVHLHASRPQPRPIEELVTDLQIEAKALNCVMVLVEAGRSGRAEFSHTLDDHLLALRWIHTHGEVWGMDAKRFALYGEGDGGWHATVLTLELRRRAGFQTALLALCQPMLGHGWSALAQDVAMLPPVFICAGSVDLFANEQLQFTRHLIESGVHTESLVIHGAVPGFHASGSRPFADSRLRLALREAVSKRLRLQEAQATNV